MFGSAAAGAPLRAMASVAVFWIMIRIISWHGPANIVWYAPDPVNGHPAGRVVKPDAKGPKRPTLTIARQSMKGRSTRRQYRSADRAIRGAGADPVAKVAAGGASRSLDLPWPYLDETGGFFLQASFRRSNSGVDAGARPISRFPRPPASRRGNNLAAYFWIHVRQGSGTGREPRRLRGRSIGNGQYGGSQAGTILSYGLFDGPDLQASLYGRFSAALDPLSQKEFALGARIQPVRNWPLAVHAEQRFDASAGGVAGTAFYATGGTGPDPVIERFALETYAQAGYILGRNETYFFDGSATVQRAIAEIEGNKLAVGAGAWAGGQRDIHRLDLGPRASFDLPLGGVLTRIALDGRVRIAGNARPGSGAALTVSASF